MDLIVANPSKSRYSKGKDMEVTPCVVELGPAMLKFRESSPQRNKARQKKERKKKQTNKQTHKQTNKQKQTNFGLFKRFFKKSNIIIRTLRYK